MYWAIFFFFLGVIIILKNNLYTTYILDVFRKTFKN